MVQVALLYMPLDVLKDLTSKRMDNCICGGQISFAIKCILDMPSAYFKFTMIVASKIDAIFSC